MYYITDLPSPEAQSGFSVHLDRLKDTTDGCLTRAKSIELEFNKWLLMVMELHQVTLSEQAEKALAEQNNKELLAYDTAKLEATKVAETTAKASAELMNKQLKAAEGAYTRASKNCPGGRYTNPSD